ncbi:MAG TPA: hypothetical protein VGC15_02155 [Acetobacteraceae bacterium]
MAGDASRSGAVPGGCQAALTAFWAARGLLARAGVKPHWRQLAGRAPFEAA